MSKKKQHPNPGITAITYGLSFLCGMATFGICSKYNLSHTTSASLSAITSSLPFSLMSAFIRDNSKSNGTQISEHKINYSPASILSTCCQTILVSAASSLATFGILNKLNARISFQEPILSLMCGIGLQAVWSIKRMADHDFAKDNPMLFSV